ncbi:MAG: ketose-bisphosphate aldolase [Erysipelotrichaceae bacterium]|nr:ketose-bisphosphate aldolase [Erysipelotrichaceae bacterium]
MLLNTKELLRIAEENGFTIGAFNVTELSNFKCVFETAERLDAPTIIAVAENEFEFCGKDYFRFVIDKLKESSVPFALHLDHGRSVKMCQRAIQAGFTSVMIDGSSLSFEENVELTRQVTELAHLADVSVEAELGTIGNVGTSDEGVETTEIIYTQPNQVIEFVEKTNCDLLAVAIGTSHGLYAKGTEPRLQIDLLKKLKKVSSVPLVLHGGSSNLDEELSKACKEGIRKINIASEYKAAISRALNRIMNETKEVKFALMLPAAIEEGKKVVEHKMRLFDSVDKAKYYRR